MCSSTDRQVAAESHEATTAADAPGSTATQLKYMSFIPCQLHLCVTSQDFQISEGEGKTTPTTAVVTHKEEGMQR